MFCRKCGIALSDENIFCNKCGCKVEQLIEAKKELDEGETSCNTNDNNDYSNTKVDVEHSSVEQDSIKIKKLSKKIRIGIIVAIIFIGYNIYYQSVYEDAKILYAKGEYYKAGNKLDSLIYFGGDDVFEKIRFSGKVGYHYKYYENDINSDNSNLFSSPDYQGALENLLFGVRMCQWKENEAKTTSEKETLKYFRDKYYNELLSVFSINKDDVNEINDLSYDEKKEKIKSITFNIVAKNKKKITYQKIQ